MNGQAEDRRTVGTATLDAELRTFEDLDVYKAARAFRITMCAVNRKLPGYDRFELASQIRRAAVSLTNNIAEGHGRDHWLEPIRFALPSRGSREELIDDLDICADEAYLPAAEAAAFKAEAWRVHRLLNGYIRYLRQRQPGASPARHDATRPGGSDHADPELEDLLRAPTHPLP